MTTTQAATGPAKENVLSLVTADGQSPAQFRISQVQVLNWGAYSGLQTMTVARSGAAIVGPSGRGKSTLLDAMASVILPNPQEFNQAARDDRGKKRERTVYSYARGHTDQRQDENGRSATTNYLRPPGTPGFPSGAAITWETFDGRCATSFRLAWVGPDTDGPEAISAATVYGFVNDQLRPGAAQRDHCRPPGHVAAVEDVPGASRGSRPRRRGRLLAGPDARENAHRHGHGLNR